MRVQISSTPPKRKPAEMRVFPLFSKVHGTFPIAKILQKIPKKGQKNHYFSYLLHTKLHTKFETKNTLI